MSKRTYYRVVSGVFLVVGLLHLARIFYGWEAIVAGAEIPMWVSWAAVLIAGYLSVRGWQFANKH